MEKSFFAGLVCAVAAFTWLLGGCARSQATRFYVLTPAERTEQMPSGSAESQQLVLGIGPIRFPEYLDRPQITGRANGNRLALAEFDRWAEPLESGFSRVIAENLSMHLGTDRVLVFPWKSNERIDYRITIDVLRFDGVPGGEVKLVTRWASSGPDDRELSLPRGSTIIVPTTAEGFEALAGAMSKAIERLSLEIASALGTSG